MKTFEIKLDIEKTLYSPMQILFNVSNSDVDSVELQFEFTQDENPFDLTGKNLEMVIRKPSRKVIHQNLEIQDAIEGKATCLLHQNAYEEYGIHNAEIHITGAGTTIVVSPFYFNTWESIVQTNEETTDGTTGDVYWNNVLNKPTTFPPQTHSHEILDVNGLQSALDSKANAGETGGGVPEDHTHEILDVNGLQTTLDGKANTIHTHAIGNVDGLQNALDSKVDDAELDGKADANHNHGILDVEGLQTALDSKASDIELDGKVDWDSVYLKTETYKKTEVYNKTEVDQMTFDGGGSNIIVEDNLTSTSTTNALSSNQGRILDETKADSIHSHDIADVSGLSGELEMKADVNHTHTEFAPTVHNHAIGDITNLSTTLNAKADSTDLDAKADAIHTHAIADVTNLQTTLDGKVDDAEMTGKADAIHTHSFAELTETPTSFPPEIHTHEIGDVNGLATALDGKVDDAELDGKADAIHTHSYGELTETPTSFPPDAHTHTKADITDFDHTHDYSSLSNIPATFTPPLMGAGTVGGGRTGNGLRMVGEYLTIREGAGIKANTTTYALDVDRAQTDDWYVQNATGQNLTMWKGTQTEYDGITTPDANTLYFIVG